jgi:hypothetical protein
MTSEQLQNAVIRNVIGEAAERVSAEARGLSVAAKKGTSLAVEREPGVGLRSGLRWAQKSGRS